MRRAAVFAAVLLAAGLAAAELELKTLQEDSSPGESSGTYAIVEDGRVLGMVQRWSSSSAIDGAPQHRPMLGRRGGPSDDVVPPHAAALLDLMRARMDVVSALQHQLLASRCAFARQMALARMRAAAAAMAAGVGADAASDDALPLPPTKLFGGPHMGGPHGMVLRHRHAGPMMGEPEPFDPTHPFLGMLTPDGEPFPGPHHGPHHHGHHHGERHHMRDGQREPMHKGPHHDMPHQPAMLMREGGGMAVPWERLAMSAMPAPGAEPEVNWRLHNADGSLNWGLLTFILLAAACVVVWGAMLVQYCSYCCARAAYAEAYSPFITRADEAAQPLLDEEDEDPKAALKGQKEGLEYAAAHVPQAVHNVAVLQYDAPTNQ